MTESEIILALEDRWVSKEELQEMLGTSERQVRGYITMLDKKLQSFNKCVLSTSRRCGYHIPNVHNEDDIALVNGALKELESKAIAIFDRRKVLKNFTQFATSVADSKENQQLSLF